MGRKEEMEKEDAVKEAVRGMEGEMEREREEKERQRTEEREEERAYGKRKKLE